MTVNISEYSTVSQVSEYLNIPEVTIYYYIRNNIIPSEKILGRILIKNTDVETFHKNKKIHDQFKVCK